MGGGVPNLAGFYDPPLPEFFESSLDCGAFPVDAVYMCSKAVHVQNHC